MSEPLTLVLDCGEEPDTYVLDNFTLRLVQPGFGIAEEDTTWKAFPPGGLVFEAEGEVNSLPFTARAPNQQALYAVASEGWAQLWGTGGAWIQFQVPCGEEETNVLVWWGFEGVEALEQPPVVTIDVASTVSCPDEVELAKTLDDPDGDACEPRWLVDGVLMHAGTTAIDFTSSHELVALSRDERGATGSDRKVVSCL